MVIREGYRTNIGYPFDSFKGRLDGYPGRLPNKYKYRGQALSSQRVPARRKSALNTNVYLIGQTYILLFLHTYKSLHPSRANA